MIVAIFIPRVVAVAVEMATMRMMAMVVSTIRCNSYQDCDDDGCMEVSRKTRTS